MTTKIITVTMLGSDDTVYVMADKIISFRSWTNLEWEKGYQTKRVPSTRIQLDGGLVLIVVESPDDIYEQLADES